MASRSSNLNEDSGSRSRRGVRAGGAGGWLTLEYDLDRVLVERAPKPQRTAPPAAAPLSLAATAVFLVLVAALHVLKPELDPSWRFISEYAIGQYGWLMVLAFQLLALSYIALFVALGPEVRTAAGRVGLLLLLVSAVGLAMAAIFTADPVTAGEDALTTHGKLHNVGATLGLAMPAAAVLVGRSLARNPAWSSARRAVAWAGGAAVAGFLVGFGSLGIVLSRSGGRFGPDVLVGWPNRIEMLGYCAWAMVVAWHASRVNRRAARDRLFRGKSPPT